MRAFGKHITGAFRVCTPDDDTLIGMQVTTGTCECCGAPVAVTRFGLGVVEFNLFVQDDGHGG